MERNSTVNIGELRAVVNNIFDFIEKDLGKVNIDLTTNFYWSVPDNLLYAMDKEPTELDCGSLVDDWDFVKTAADKPEQAIPLTLLHVAPLLQALAVLVPSHTSPKSR